MQHIQEIMLTNMKRPTHRETKPAQDELKDDELDQVSGGLMKADPVVPESGGISGGGGGGSVIGAVGTTASIVGSAVGAAANRIGSAVGSLFGKP